MLIIGLTGGVASGKNFVADQFEKRFHIPSFDADKQVHEIYAHNAEIFAQIKQRFPNAIINNQIDRKELGKLVLNNPENLSDLENIIHPQVRKDQEAFIAHHQKQGSQAVILNIPLLFEKGFYKQCDKNILVVIDKQIQEQRFITRAKLQNPQLSEAEAKEKFSAIFQKQMSDKDKRQLADFIIDNNESEDNTIAQIKQLGNRLFKVGS